MKDILFIVCTHGNELEPLKIIEEIVVEIGQDIWDRKFDFLIANPMAVDRKKRFIDIDLNRVYPGNIESKFYEERRAAEILEYAKNFKCVIDIHTTKANTGLFTLLTKNTPKNIELAKKMLPNNIVIWESISKRKIGPITSILDFSCELECSIVNKSYLLELKSTILKLTKEFNLEDENVSNKTFYKVIGSIPKNEKINYNILLDFKKMEYKNEIVYPLLVGVYSDKLSYIMKEINI